MTSWTPTLTPDSGPKYRRLAQAIAQGMSDGDLQPGDRLPTHRELADSLGVALTTVTRGYAEAERRGLVVGEVGRGTFVRSWAPCLVSQQGVVADLSANHLPPRPQAPELFEQIFRRLARGGGRSLLDYQPHRGTDRQVEAGAHWIEREGVEAHADQVVVTSGVQHAMAVVLASMAEPGDTILVEELTYCGLKTLARVLHLNLEAVPIDAEGLIPDALRSACERGEAKGLYCMPRLQNPTAVTMSDQRRGEIAEIALEFGLPVIEDDSYGFLAREALPLSALLPESYYLCGTSKSVMPGLRIGFVRAPREMTRKMESVIAATTYMAPALLAEVTADWILDGTAEKIMQWKRDEAAARQAMARTILGPHGYSAHRSSQHGWLRLAEPWSADRFARRSEREGVLVTPAEEFAAPGVIAPEAVRICLGPPSDRATLETGLGILAGILAERPAPRRLIV